MRLIDQSTEKQFLPFVADSSCMAISRMAEQCVGVVGCIANAAEAHSCMVGWHAVVAVGNQYGEAGAVCAVSQPRMRNYRQHEGCGQS